MTESSKRNYNTQNGLLVPNDPELIKTIELIIIDSKSTVKLYEFLGNEKLNEK